ncbi:MAG TPA: glycine zipper 2TM domain-containing protein [Rhodanobacteraceae bacterium]|nr:glycine zipper 2TM domain-containing protein [Rhodanobacteraceae bacterium]
MNTGINPLRLGLAVAMFGLLPISAQAERWNRCRDCGFVRSVERIEERGDSHLGGGTVLGAIVGGALGNQVGKGDGRKAATVAGAVAGGAVGHNIEKSRRTRTLWRVEVRMDDGDRRSITQSLFPDVRRGDRVQIRAGRVYRVR